MLTYGSLFTGIGGIDLGLDRAGWKCRWQVERDPYASAVLARHWPGIRRYGDIRTLNPAQLEAVDMVCGGFPCQPTSVAGKRLGAADDRWLWPEFARILGCVRPRFALLENPPGLLSFREFGDVLGDLALLGFDAEWDCIPAVAVGAPHRRDRIFVVAYARGPVLRNESGRVGWPSGQGAAKFGDYGAAGSVADADGADRWPIAEGRNEPDGHDPRWQETPGGSRLGGEAADVADTEDAYGWWPGSPDDARWRDSETGGRGVGRARFEHWLTEPDVGRVANGIPSRVDRLTCLGNAVVPQVAEVIGRLIAEVA